MPSLRVEFDRETCIGMYNCVEAWEKFVADREAGKASLVESDEIEPDRYVREVPDDEPFEAKMAARVCPVDAITIYDGDEQLVP